MRIFKLHKTSQDYEGFFTGDVPEYAVNILGSGTVDASQIASMFGNTNEAIQLVNQFDPSLLGNISFIFNFSKDGAYGVYLSELDRAIKTKALQKELESQGYEVKTNEQGLLTAYPTQEKKDPETIQNDIDKIYENIKNQGGSAFGINMNAILDASRQDAQQSESEDPNIWEWMAILHLGGTLVHEATHAKGHMEEATPESAENSFVQWALPKVNEMYRASMEATGKGEMFTPLSVGTDKRHAKGTHWYKKAQYYLPNSALADPRGSDLAGRFLGIYEPQKGRAGWSLTVQQDESTPIEKRLSREYMTPLPQDLSQEHDILEEQLRKYRTEPILDATATTEELLTEDHDVSANYKTLEEQLEETRPHPLMVPLKKNASINKVATVFGWMNNLEISDGSTIPGLSDRVMAWDDRDESFSEEEEWIRQQPRYNPTYDIKGFYYRWIEPRFHPQLFDDMTRDYSNTHPAKRFASNSLMDPDLIKVISILSDIKSKILKKDIWATRLIMTEDVAPIVSKLFDEEKSVDIAVYETDQAARDDLILAVWLFSSNIHPEKIEKMEKHFQGRFVEDAEKIIEEVLQPSIQREKVIKEIIETVRDICSEYGIKDVYIAGGFPRTIAMENPFSDVSDLDFSGAWPNQSIKVGGLLAERLGVRKVEFFHRTMTLSFTYKDVKVDFKGNFSPIDVRNQMRARGIKTTPLNMDIYNRDFTINMLIYDVMFGKIYDVSGESKGDIERKVIRTFFDSKFVIQENPLIILRALKFKIRYDFRIADDLSVAMMEGAPALFAFDIPKERLIMAREEIKKEGIKEAQKLFEEYGLERLEGL